MSPTQYQVLAHLLWQNNLREKKITECYGFKFYSSTAFKICGGINFKVTAEKDICVSRWLDNGVVTIASTFAGVEPIDQVRRWSESAKEHIMIDRPHSIGVYNKYMGGVDKIGYLISLYRIKVKIRKWPVHMFFHFLDLAVANSWLEYCDFELEHGTLKSNISDLLALRNEVGRALTMATVLARSADRPRSELHKA